MLGWLGWWVMGWCAFRRMPGRWIPTDHRGFFGVYFRLNLQQTQLNGRQLEAPEWVQGVAGWKSLVFEWESDLGNRIFHCEVSLLEDKKLEEQAFWSDERPICPAKLSHTTASPVGSGWGPGAAKARHFHWMANSRAKFIMVYSLVISHSYWNSHL